MTEQNRLRPTAVVTGPRRTPIEKVEEIYALMMGDDKITPSLLRIRIIAICEGRLVPTSRKAFIALAMRSGVSRAKCYTAWQEWSGELPCVALAPEDGEDGESLETALY